MEKARSFCEFVVRIRYPVLALLFFTFWAPFSLVFLPSVLGNVLLIESYRQLCVFAFSTSMAILFAILNYRIIRYRTSLDSADSSSLRFLSWQSIPMALLFLSSASASPIVAYCFSYSQKELQQNHLYAALAILVGVGASLVVFAVLAFLRTYLFGDSRNEVEFFPFENFFDKYAKKETSISTEFEVFIYALVIAAIYFFYLRPNGYHNTQEYFSVPAYVVWCGWLGSLLITPLSFWLDKARIPPLLVLILVVICVRGCAEPESFETVAKHSTGAVEDQVARAWKGYQEKLSGFVSRKRQDSGEAKKQLDDNHSEVKDRDRYAKLVVKRTELENLVWSSIQSRIHNAPEGPSLLVNNGQQKERPVGKTLVVVTCPGGGIHAAAWAAHVLEQLDARYEGFRDSIALISGVSGGSVGTMFYSSTYFFDDKRGGASSSLESIAAGLAFDDVPAAFVPELLPFFERYDRGRRLENAWNERLSPEAKNLTFSDWGDKARLGKMPVIVLNATDAKSGRRVLFDSIPSPPRHSLDGHSARPINYRELLSDSQKQDIRVVSAARCSATFPYVSPFVKPDKASILGATIAIGDGGYIDNEGILTALDWIDFISRRFAVQRSEEQSIGIAPDPETQFRRIVLVRIQPSADEELPPQSLGFAGRVTQGFRWLTGPLEALATMRTTSQLERAQFEADLTTSYIDYPWWGQQEGAEVFKENSIVSKGFQEQLNLEVTLAFKKRESVVPAVNKEDDDLPTPQISVGPQNSDPIDLPVIVLPFPFVADEQNTIPLNWKLSEKQKQAYPKAWKKLESSTSGGRNVYFEILDKLFRQSETSKGD